MCTKIMLYSMFFLITLSGCVTTPKFETEDYLKPNICGKYFKDDSFTITNDDRVKDLYLVNDDLWNRFNDHYRNAKQRKILVFLDGTNNERSDLTNIRKLYLLSVLHACNDNPVVPYYDKGVGAKWFELFYGAPQYGTGVSLNIRQAYRFLAQVYQPGDKIYIFGFSRGAFTARSLNGLIEYAGILQAKKNDLPGWLKWIRNFEGIETQLYNLYNKIYDDKEKLKDAINDFEKKHKDLSFNKVKVEGIGVFDTVPALGKELDDEPKNHQLELYANKGVHALSLDEQRSQFKLLRFKNPKPKEQHLSEVWFSGVHSNLGGGYSHTFNCNKSYKKAGAGYYDGLETTPLNWMISKFNNDDIFPKDIYFRECINGRMHDEYYDGTILKVPLYRTMGVILPRRPKNGDIIHESVVRRMKLLLTEETRNFEREPIGKYIPNNLISPIPCNYIIEISGHYDNSHLPNKELTCKFYENKN